ncbi:MAG TPA: hypothetical protein VK842_05015 [bacterium]|jgi:hypothetical protein|nr:hypothetical protein [bacterium]
MRVLPGMIGLLVFLAAPSALRSASAGPGPRLEWEWHAPQTEIQDLAFSNQGSELAASVNYLWPDGVDAESYPQAFLAALSERAQREPRFADPKVMILSKAGVVDTLPGWGWSPAFSPDDAKVAFSSQVQPATGKRILAATLAGNELALYDRSSHAVEKLVSPLPDEHVGRSVFTEDGKGLFYEIGAAVNGEWQGAIGVGWVALPGAKEAVLVEPKKVLGYWVVVDGLSAMAGGVFADLWVPAHKGPEDYLADRYDEHFVKIGADGRQTELMAASRSIEERETLLASAGPAGGFSVAKNGQLDRYDPAGQLQGSQKMHERESLVAQSYRAGWLAFLVGERFEQGGQAIVFRSLDGKMKYKLRVPGDFDEMVPSGDGKKIAMVDTRDVDKNGEHSQYDCVSIFDID